MNIFEYYECYKKNKLKMLNELVYKLIASTNKKIITIFERNGLLEFISWDNDILILKSNIRKKELKEIIKFYKLLDKKGIVWKKEND